MRQEIDVRQPVTTGQILCRTYFRRIVFISQSTVAIGRLNRFGKLFSQFFHNCFNKAQAVLCFGDVH